MTYNAKILLDSISPTGKRITTFEITFPRIVHAEAKTHRVIKRDDVIEEYFFAGIGMNDEDNLSRNTASSRAIPIKSMIQRILDDTFIPEKWPVNGKGMQPEGFVEDEKIITYNIAQWLKARDNAIESALNLYNHGGVHKQIANRLLEPFMWQTMICTATEWDNFFKLRTNEDAQYEIKRIADLMYEAHYVFENENYDIETHYDSLEEERLFKNTELKVIGSKEWSAIRPQKLEVGEWHCPLIEYADYELIDEYWKKISGENYTDEFVEIMKKVSVARCARVSYLTHDGKRDIGKDLELFEKLRSSGHWSPFEHVATPYFNFRHTMGYLYHQPNTDNNGNYRSGNFIGWKQFRKEFQDENCNHFRKEE